MLGEKIQVDSIYNCLVNDQGKHSSHYKDLNFCLTGLYNTNMGGDLKVEHENLAFKNGLIHLAGTLKDNIQGTSSDHYTLFIRNLG